MVAACSAAPGLVRAQSVHSPFAAISGVVLNDSTGAPILRAAITLSTLGATPLDAVTFSDSSGAFGFNTIPPAKYQLHVDLDGFEQAWFGAATPTRPPGTLNLAAGDIRYGITFRLRPLGSISGVVLDADGDPVPNAQIRLLKSIWERRKPAYRNEAWAAADDRGCYRFAEVLPGQYIVMASQTYGLTWAILPEVAVGQSYPPKVYAVEFYPDASRLSAAEPVPVAAGKEVGGIDFHLVSRVASTLRGKVVVPADLPANTNVMISVFPQDVPDGAEQSVAVGTSGPGFEFEIGNLSAGPYVLVASLSVAGREYRAVERIELPPGGQEVTMHPERAIDLPGRVDREGGQRPAGRYRVSLEPGGFSAGRSRIQMDAQPDGTFVVPNVAQGIWDVSVEPIPAGGYLKSMRLGDRDVLTEDMTIEPGTHEPLRIVVSSHGAVVGGTVTVPPGVARSARASVLLAPCGKYASVLSFYALGSSDDAGNFEFQGITPGSYKLYAFEELDPSAYQDPNFLKPFEKFSEPFDVPEGGRVERKTRLIVAGN